MPQCEVCFDLEYPKDISKRSATAYRRFSSNSEDLFDSAERGCSSCCLIRDAVLIFVPELEPSENVYVIICLQEYSYNEEVGDVFYTPTPMPFITVTDFVKKERLAQIDLFREACRSNFSSQCLMHLVHLLMFPETPLGRGTPYRSHNVQTQTQDPMPALRALLVGLTSVGNITAATHAMGTT